MLLQHNAVMALRHNGQPLHLTTTSHSPHTHTLEAQSRGSFFMRTVHDEPDIVTLIHQAFRHYPAPVTINTQQVERTPFPNLSNVHIAQAPSLERVYTRLDAHPLAHHQPGCKHFNTFAGGILINLFKANNNPDKYFTQLDGPESHWKPCGMAITTPVYVMQDDELDTITDSDWTNIWTGNTHLAPFSDAFRQRAEDQLSNTLNHPDMPDRYPSEPFQYITGAPLDSSQARRLASPIAVLQTPAIFSDQSIAGPQLVSASQALYRTNTGLVPVLTMDGHEEQEGKPQPCQTIESVTFHAVPNRTVSSQQVRPVQELTATFIIPGSTEVTVPAPFAFYGNDLKDIRVDFVPSRTSPDDLLTHIVRASQEYSDYSIKQFRDEELEQTTAAVQELLAHLPAGTWQH